MGARWGLDDAAELRVTCPVNGGSRYDVCDADEPVRFTGVAAHQVIRHALPRMFQMMKCISTKLELEQV